MNNQKSKSYLALLSLSMLSCVHAATDSALLDLLVSNNVITSEQAGTIETTESGLIDSALLSLLVSNGAITQEQAFGLKNTTQSAPATAPLAPAPAAEQPSFIVKAKDKAVDSITISGRIHAQMDYLSTDYGNAASPDDELNLFLRRLYLGVSADIGPKVTGSLTATFGSNADGDGKLEKALVSFKLSDQHKLDLGFQKTPFGIEETTSSSKIPAVERSIATRYFTEQLDYGARHTGITLHGNYDSGVSFSLALTNPSQGVVASGSENDEIAIWARTSWAGEVSGAHLELGANGGWIPDQRVDGSTDLVWGVFARTQFEALRFDFEYLSGVFENATASGDAKPQALYLTSVFNLNPSINLVGRVSFLDADGGVGADISSTMRRAPENGAALFDTAEAYYIGADWLIKGNSIKLSFGYEWANYSDNLTGSQGDATINSVRSRLQLLF